MSYGRHQSFYIRKNWISKGIRGIIKNRQCVYNTDFISLGLGKNMVEALRFWLEFSNIVEMKNNGHDFTDFGQLIIDHDLSCTKKTTINLIHFFLTSSVNKIKFDSFYWFYNICNEKYFEKQTLIKILEQWDLEQPNKNVSINTIKRDMDCLLSTYTKDTPDHPEDKNYSFLGHLGLIKQDGDLFFKNPIKEEEISLIAMYYIILLQKEKLVDLTLDDIVSEKNSIGKIFNLKRIDVINILEKLEKKFPITLEKTNNLNNIRFTNNAKKYIDPSAFLKNFYESSD